ncbi:MAG: phosphoribosyltransferase [Syntrophomonadaceae bacterium]|nr:phosphoribosyltransferase [Syntrophomonadaceae bacterium]
MFKNRREAGYLLAQALEKQAVDFDVVLGVPRGGAVIAEAVADYFNRGMDVVLARKVSSPNWEEYAVGAVAPDGEILIHERVRDLIDTDMTAVNRLAEQVRQGINERLNYYRSQRPPIDLKDKKVLLVDDGIATGFTLKAAISYLNRQDTAGVIIAAPVSSRSAYLDLSEVVEQMIVLEKPENFYAVGQFYEDFASVDDEQVVDILKRTIA